MMKWRKNIYISNIHYIFNHYDDNANDVNNNYIIIKSNNNVIVEKKTKKFL